MSAEQRLQELGIELPESMVPPGKFVLARRHGDTIYLSGQAPLGPDGFVTGKVGTDITLEQARDAARLTGINLLAALRAEVGSLDEVTAVLKLLGMVNCAPGFNNTPAVIDGCSELLHDVFGPDIGSHARSAVGMAELPFDISVEIEMIVAVG